MATPAKKKKRRLGKGLESLLGKPVEVSPPPVVETPTSKLTPTASPTVIPEVERNASPADGLVYLSVDCIVPNPRQPRQVFDDDGLTNLFQILGNSL